MSTCPSEDRLLAYVTHGRDADQLLGHLDGCDDCRQLMAAVVRGFAPAPPGAHAAAGAVDTLSAGERLLDRYQIRRFIARGGMGEVYEAFDELLDERVALKTLACTALDDPRAALRFRAEARLARRVTHPNVCRILEYGVHARPEPISFLTMEYLEGETLRARVARRGGLPEAEALPLARQVLAGLAAIHGAGIVHRDLKSENVFLVPDGRGGERAVLMDFGLARALDGSIVSTWPRTRALAGTLDCMAPEQIEGKPLGVAADVFACGVLLFELLTGRRPFVGLPPATRLRAVAPAPSTLAPALGTRWDAVIARCLALRPSERHADAAALADALPRPGWPAAWRRLLRR